MKSYRNIEGLMTKRFSRLVAKREQFRFLKRSTSDHKKSSPRRSTDENSYKKSNYYKKDENDFQKINKRRRLDLDVPVEDLDWDKPDPSNE
jgi:hypothetical protein